MQLHQPLLRSPSTAAAPGRTVRRERHARPRGERQRRRQPLPARGDAGGTRDRDRRVRLARRGKLQPQRRGVHAHGTEAASKAVWLRVCDGANNCTDASDTIGWDKTAPVIVQHDFSPAANAAGWHNTDITVRFKATDALSGLNAACLTAFPNASGDRLQSKVISTEGDPVSVNSDSCADVAGNTAGPKTSQNFKLDKTAPSVVVSLARGPRSQRLVQRAGRLQRRRNGHLERPRQLPARRAVQRARR